MSANPDVRLSIIPPFFDEQDALTYESIEIEGSIVVNLGHYGPGIRGFSFYNRGVYPNRLAKYLSHLGRSGHVVRPDHCHNRLWEGGGIRSTSQVVDSQRHVCTRIASTGELPECCAKDKLPKACPLLQRV